MLLFVSSQSVGFTRRLQHRTFYMRLLSSTSEEIGIKGLHALYPVLMFSVQYYDRWILSLSKLLTQKDCQGVWSPDDSALLGCNKLRLSVINCYQNSKTVASRGRLRPL